MRTARGLLALTIFIPIVTLGAMLMACGVNWFPRCDDPKHPCPNVEPDYPPTPPMAKREGGTDFGPKDTSDQ